MKRGVPFRNLWICLRLTFFALASRTAIMAKPAKSFFALAAIITVATGVLPAQAQSQPAPRAMVIAWDGAVPSFVSELLKQGKLPNLAKLIEGGTWADNVIPVLPSKTAPGLASLWTGALPRLT